MVWTRQTGHPSAAMAMVGPVLITGAAGNLGQALTIAYGARAVALPRAGLDIANEEAVAAALDRFHPGAVINAAADSNVDGCEADPASAARSNAIGPGVLARACAQRAIPFVHVSTDYVFGADALVRARHEDDAPAPLNTYGRSKLEGERAVLSVGGRSVVARTSWVFAFRGCFIDRMMAKAKTEGRLILTDQVSTPTPVAALAHALAQIAERLGAGNVLPPLLHVAGAPAATRTQWVEEALSSFDLPVEITRVALAESGDRVARPHSTPLDTTRFARLFGGALAWKPAARAWAKRSMDGG